ncbi:glycosyltransferase, MGT family [Eubacterium pyruvativorans]|uniref:Glycosyltransferase, MGT family n=1 Tax=Eubacterium pyruvativorans TaxID=155865 RepID=A0A1I7I4G7_9FIRM|nr:macrolide family glycosyltransferase [Eubacterium pyruvativorans]SFO37168.1 glycosyltransferase, MGT family [Eubacterium pyruvativorans]SFU67808.1 glycosyltransferase, MGT family [Eubacterium pyruvativorans]
MKIAWFCIPAHGHTNPTLGLVKALTEAGHQVWYFSFEEFREKIENAGATFIGCDGYDFEMEDKGNADRVGKDKVYATELLVSSTLALDEMTSRVIGEIKPDIVVSDSVAFWGKLAAMKHGLPYVSSTTTFAFNKYSAKYMQESTWDIARMLVALPRINKQLKRLRDEGYPVKSLLDIVQNDNDTNTIVYTSKYFQPCSETFSDRYHFIGPSIRPVTKPMEKTADKLVYISMGTVNQNREFYRNCIHALGQTDWQVIISMGTNPEHYDQLPDNIHIYESVDQMAVLSIADAFITHCGMNSASEGLYFQVPLVLFPQTPEQDAVARRTEELSAGIRLKSISEEDILDALNQVLNNPKYKVGVARVSESFKKCGGNAEAKAFLERLTN